MPDAPVIGIVDDDSSMREALQGLVQSLGCRAVAFASAEHFLAAAEPAALACLILDVRMPGLDGIALQALLRDRGHRLPILFMTSYVDARTRARALEGGAIGFLGKPVDDDALIACLRGALAAQEV
ncbi:response regulator [Roseomonas hellenica]|uniref:Response regulator n=1 Tax=Plastoroseomonas hellenica TaxID=2687306 RepID=A0ABS5F5N3_9PROT|nr:response regulator [Plastoroseomonas hellenica]